jgi:hypothetical protein
MDHQQPERDERADREPEDGGLSFLGRAEPTDDDGDRGGQQPKRDPRERALLGGFVGVALDHFVGVT